MAMLYIIREGKKIDLQSGKLDVIVSFEEALPAW